MCEHISWLRLAGRDDFYIHNSNRLSQLLRTLPNPKKQYPYINLFLGTKAKNALLPKIVNIQKRRQRRQDGFLDLHFDDDTIYEEQPHIIIEGDINHVVPPIYTNREFCHEDEMLSIN